MTLLAKPGFMSPLSRTDNAIYAVSAWAAAVAGLVAMAYILIILAWGGTGSTGLNIAAIFGLISTLLLLAGALAAASPRSIFPFLTIMGGLFAPCAFVIAFRHDLGKSIIATVSDLPLPWLMILLTESSAIVLSAAKLIQLRISSRQIPWPH